MPVLCIAATIMVVEMEMVVHGMVSPPDLLVWQTNRCHNQVGRWINGILTDDEVKEVGWRFWREFRHHC